MKSVTPKRSKEQAQAGLEEPPIGSDPQRKSQTMSPNKAYEAARGAEKKQRPDVAEKLYRKILAVKPDHGKSVHALALITLKSDRLEEALLLMMRRAVEVQIEIHLQINGKRETHSSLKVFGGIRTLNL